MTQDELKALVGQAALPYVTPGDIVGVGTGSTVNKFSDALASMKDQIPGAVSSSEASTARLKALGIPVFEANAVGELSVYIDGADSDGLANSAVGVIATNTTLSREAVAGLPHAQEAGGLSGAPVLQASNRVIRQLRACLGKSFPIIGVGGVLSADDAVSKIQSGANLVQFYTGLIYQGPSLVWESARALQALMDA